MDINIKITGQKCYFSTPPPPLVDSEINEALQFTVKHAKYVRNWDGVVRLYSGYSFHIGHLSIVKHIIKNYVKRSGLKVRLIITDTRRLLQTNNTIIPQLKEKNLLDYQQEAADVFIKNEIGSIQIPTGGGKTLISAEIARRLNCKTLFVVNRNILLHQTIEEYKKLLGVDIGIIGDGEVDIKDISVSSIQTLAKKAKSNKDIAEYLKNVQLVIFDECHFTAAESFQNLGYSLPNARYRLGLSATVRREDNKDLMISAVVGQVIYDIKPWQVEMHGIIITPTCYFVKNELESVGADFKESYERNIVNNSKRNTMIADICKKFSSSKILVIVGRVKHGEILKELIPNSFLVNGKIEKEKRKNILNEFSKLNSNVLIGTASIFSTGYNNPAIDVIINASGNAGFNMTIQSAGRVMRSCAEKGKEKAYFIDFMDDKGFHRRHSFQRFKSLRSYEYSVDIIENIDSIK